MDKISQVWTNFHSQPMDDNVRTVFKYLFQRLSVIRRVIASDRCITITLFFEYCIDTYVYILEEFPWCLISDSLHRLLAHIWEHIVLNGNFGLASENEQRVECTHKERRQDRATMARKTDLWSNLVDTFRAGFAAGDPGVRYFDRQPHCSRCQSSGDHWTRGCPKKQTQVVESDDLIVEQFFCDSENQPEDQINLAERLFAKEDT